MSQKGNKNQFKEGGGHPAIHPFLRCKKHMCIKGRGVTYPPLQIGAILRAVALDLAQSLATLAVLSHL